MYPKVKTDPWIYLQDDIAEIRIKNPTHIKHKIIEQDPNLVEKLVLEIYKKVQEEKIDPLVFLYAVRNLFSYALFICNVDPTGHFEQIKSYLYLKDDLKIAKGLEPLVTERLIGDEHREFRYHLAKIKELIEGHKNQEDIGNKPSMEFIKSEKKD